MEYSYLLYSLNNYWQQICSEASIVPGTRLFDVAESPCVPSTTGWEGHFFPATHVPWPSVKNSRNVPVFSNYACCSLKYPSPDIQILLSFLHSDLCFMEKTVGRVQWVLAKIRSPYHHSLSTDFITLIVIWYYIIQLFFVYGPFLSLECKHLKGKHCLAYHHPSPYKQDLCPKSSQ